MKKLKIAFCIPDMIIGGTENVFIRTLEELYKLSHLDIIVVTHKKIQEPFYVNWFRAHPNIKVISILALTPYFDKSAKYTKFFPLKNIRKIIFSVYKKIKRFRFLHNRAIKDVDIFIDYKSFSFFKEFSRISKPKLTWVHGSIKFFEDMKYIDRVQYYDKIVALSDEFVHDFQQLYPQYADKIVHIYNPINISDIRRLADENKCDVNHPYFCAVSRLDTDKDIETIINAFNEFWLAQDRPDVKLLLIGDGIKTNRLKQMSRELEACQQIIFTGTKSIPFGYMKGSIAHILSSYREGLPTVLIEAQAVGTLNIASRCKNGVSEILLDGKAGLLFQPGDIKALSKHMSDVYLGNIDKEIMIQNADNGLVRFDSKTIVDSILSVIQRMI